MDMIIKLFTYELVFIIRTVINTLRNFVKSTSNQYVSKYLEEAKCCA